MDDPLNRGPGDYALRATALSKRYGATRALRDVSITLRVGHVTALAGGNGAGKSTLIRLLTGVERPDDGEISRNGVAVRLASPHDATLAGIFCVYQDQPYVPQMRVFEQVHLGHEHRFRRNGLVSDRSMRDACRDLLADLGVTTIHPDETMVSLSPAARVVVALVGVIAASKLLDVEHPVILLDEPTSALSAEELEFLIEFITSLKARSAVLFVSHRVSEVLDWSDDMYVLRDATNADYMTRDSASAERVHHAMGGLADSVGQPSRDLGRSSDVGRDEPPAFTASGVRLNGRAAPFDFGVGPGEIVGLAGVEGSGKEEFLRLLAGIEADGDVDHSGITVHGEPHDGRLHELLRSGVVYLSGERQRDGNFPAMTIAENMAVSRRALAAGRAFLVRSAEERRRADRLVDRLAVKTASVAAPLSSLSGGNQQKVLLGRCLELEPAVMLLDNVTRGVDIGAKEIIYRVLRGLAEDGVAVVMASDDLDELTAVSDRIAVFRGGSLAKEFDNSTEAVNRMDLLAAMI